MRDKYNERVRAIAEEMAKEAHNRQRRVGSDCWLGLAESTKSRKINSFISAARIAVAHMAELAIKWMTAYAWTTEYIQEYLKNEGLTP